VWGFLLVTSHKCHDGTQKLDLDFPSVSFTVYSLSGNQLPPYSLVSKIKYMQYLWYWCTFGHMSHKNVYLEKVCMWFIFAICHFFYFGEKVENKWYIMDSWKLSYTVFSIVIGYIICNLQQLRKYWFTAVTESLDLHWWGCSITLVISLGPVTFVCCVCVVWTFCIWTIKWFIHV
jgi:hypothetical protein